MRYSPDHKAATRKRLLDEAGALTKRNGFGTTGVDALMAASGLTAGAFYAHFKSKSEMLEALIEQELQRSLAFLAGPDASLADRVAAYVSEPHVDHPEKGCALPALTAEIARADPETRETFERMLLQIKDRMQQRLENEDQAWSVLAQSVGAVMLARALASRKSRKALLDGVNRQMATQLAPQAGKRRKP